MLDDATFLSLPAEVRLHVYSYLFQNEWTYINYCPETSVSRQQWRRGPHIAPLLYTCQQIREEASQLYFSNLKIFLDIRTFHANGLHQWLQNVGDANVRHLRHLNVRWNNYVDITIDLSRRQHCHSSNDVGLQLKRQHNRVDSHQCVNPPHTRKTRVLHARHPSGRAPRGPPPRVPATTPSGALSTAARHDSSDRALFTRLPYQATNDILTKAMKQICFHRPVTRLPASTKLGTKHTMTIKAVPIPGLNFANDYWDINGTEKFCEALSQHLSMRLDELLIRRDGQSLTAREILGFVDEIDEHASALRWLWYW